MLSILLVMGPTAESHAGHSAHRSLRELPAPQLAYPGEEMVLAGEEVEFRWRGLIGFSGFAYYDFRLYRGTSMVKDNLIMREKIPSRHSSLKVNASLFKQGETYSWSLRLKDGFRDSRSNYSVFKAKK